MTNINPKIKMFRNVGKFCRFTKMCKLTYFTVPFNSWDDDTQWAVFSDECAANMFARNIHSVVIRESTHVYIYK